MNTKKSRFAFITLALLGILCLALLAGCTPAGSSSSVTEIFVQKSDMPRTTYVLGQDLDLSRGKISVVTDGETSPVPMTADEVTVTGYNKDQLGEQTLTVTYMEKTTTFVVTVVPRTVAENFEANYFVGDLFDPSKGRIKVTADNGSASFVNFNSSEVTLKSFDSSKAGNATVTVTYTNGQVSYDCSFDVTVHTPHTVTFTAPKQNKYSSTDTTLNLNGGYLTVKAESPSTFSKFVTLTPSMISGFDPTKITFENKDTPLVQTLTVTYAGQEFYYDVQISYSPIHLIQHVASTLTDLNWSGETLPEISETNGENAVAALKAYLDLTSSQQEQIDDATFEAVLNPATIYLNNLYFAETEKFADAFTITTSGTLNIVGKSYEAIEAAIKRLEDPNDVFNAYAELLVEISEEYGNRTILTYRIADIVVTHTPDTIGSVVQLFKQMLNLHDTLKDVPDNWTVDVLANYGDQITLAVSKILASSYIGASYTQMYDVISSWRTNDDYFDVIYSYYYYVKEEGRTEITTKLWQSVPLPGAMNDWYLFFMNTIEIERFIMQYESSNAYLYDTVGFMYYYSKTIEFADQVKTGNDQLCKDIYTLLDADTLFENNLRRGPRGYIVQMGEAIDTPAVLALWDEYLDLIEVYLNPNGISEEDFNAMVRGVFDSMTKLTPTELYSFVSSMNYLYNASHGSVLVLDCSTRVYSTLMNLVAGYYYNTLPESVFTCFQDMLVAMENLSLLNIKENALDAFKEKMEAIENAYNKKLSDEDKELFNRYFGDVYTKYSNLYKAVTDPDYIQMGEWEAKYNELKETIQNFETIYLFIINQDTTTEAKNHAMPLLFALYEKATALYDELCATDATVSSALYTKIFLVGEADHSMEQYYFAVKKVFITFMVSSGITLDSGESYMTWDLYQSASLDSFFAKIADLMVAEYNGTLYTKGDVADLVAAFRNLSPADKNVLFILGGNKLYYAGLDRYFTNLLNETDATSGIISALLKTEIAYAVYENSMTDENLQAFKTQAEELTTLYGQLTDADAFETVVGDLYDYYTAKYEELKNA